MLDAAASRAARPLGDDGPGRLRERMQLLDLAPSGTVSAGGSCRLLPTADGTWVAVNLARRDDVDLVAAWLGRPWTGPVWDAIATALADTSARTAVERAQLLGLPVAIAAAPPPVRAPAPRLAGPRAHDPRRVVDLSNLWAGPLCAHLVGVAIGAPIVKVEDAARPDGARAGPPAFWARLNAGKEERVLPFAAPDGRAALGELLDTADVVVTSARARALDALGLDPEAAAALGVVWVAITGYGRHGGERDWVAFGDDAAVAGGAAVLAGEPGQPRFVLDAVADPLAGLVGAVAAVDALAAGRGAVVDVALRDVVADALDASHYPAKIEPEVA